MARGFSRVSLDLTDFQEGFSIVDERALRFEQLLDQDGEEVNSTRNLSFDEKYSQETERIVAELDRTNFLINLDVMTPAGIYIAAHIDTLVNKRKVAWYGLKEDGDDANRELLQDLQDETFKDVMTSLQLSWLLASRREQLREFWGESTDSRFGWLIKQYSTIHKHLDTDAARTNIMGFINALNRKLERKRTEGEEYKLIWSVFGLLNIGYDSSFPVIFSTREKDNQEAYKAVCRAIGQYIFWSLIEKKRRDTEWDGEEPGPTYKVEDKEHTFERDFNDYEKMARDGSAEPWLQMCYSNFQYNDDEGNEHQILYRRATDSKESWRSIRVGTAALTFIAQLYNSKVNLRGYRINKPNHITNGLTLANYIKYLSGKLITSTKKIELDGQLIDCKVYSQQVLLEYQYKLLWKAFWALYQDQVSVGIIKQAIPIEVTSIP